MHIEGQARWIQLHRIPFNVGDFQWQPPYRDSMVILNATAISCVSILTAEQFDALSILPWVDRFLNAQKRNRRQTHFYFKSIERLQ
jgi:hypothetical protein